MALSPSTFRRLVVTANLAPSVHNTQPTRWRLDRDSAILLLTDNARRLAVGDPEGRDARLSCGAALEGTRLALSEIGLAVAAVERLPQAEGPALSPAVRIAVKQAATSSDPLAEFVQRRFTWRGGFAKADGASRRRIAEIAASHDDAALVSDATDIEMFAGLNDAASLSFLRRRPYREELLHWMRLSKSHPGWSVDGLNAQSLGMTRFEAAGASVVLRSPVFEMLDAVRMSGTLVSEGAKTRSAAAIVLFHRPVGEDPVDSGVAFYRLLLSLAAYDLSAWPMAVLADDPDHRAEISGRFSISPERRLVNVLRVGLVPAVARPGRARIDAGSLIV